MRWLKEWVIEMVLTDGHINEKKKHFKLFCSRINWQHEHNKCVKHWFVWLALLRIKTDKIVQVQYCSRECQKADFKKHKPLCNKPAKPADIAGCHDGAESGPAAPKARLCQFCKSKGKTLYDIYEMQTYLFS